MVDRWVLLKREAARPRPDSDAPRGENATGGGEGAGGSAVAGKHGKDTDGGAQGTRN